MRGNSRVAENVLASHGGLCSLEIISSLSSFPCTFLLPCRSSPQWARVSSLSRINDLTQTHLSRQDSSGRVISSSQQSSTWQSTTLTTDTHAFGWILTRSPNKRAAADPHFRPRSHLDRLSCRLVSKISVIRY